MVHLQIYHILTIKVPRVMLRQRQTILLEIKLVSFKILSNVQR